MCNINKFNDTLTTKIKKIVLRYFLSLQRALYWYFYLQVFSFNSYSLIKLCLKCNFVNVEREWQELNVFQRGVWNGTFYSDTSQHPTQPCLTWIMKTLLFYYWIQTRFYQHGWGHPDRYNHRKSAARYYFIDENEWKLSSIFRNLWPEIKDTLLGNQDGRKRLRFT